jgi:glycolate oxidase iron-sulfur subunit
MDGPDSPLDPGGHLAAAAGDCVHCGFCLPACPTYQLWGEEMDSPRGRIHLMSQVLDGAPVTQAVTTHLDRCLGCMACMPACPSGVRYNELIEAARAWPQESMGRGGGAGASTGRGGGAGANTGRGGGAGASTGRGGGAGASTGRGAGAGTAADGDQARVARSLHDRATRAAIFATFPYRKRLRALSGPLRAAQRSGLDRLVQRSPVTRYAPELASSLRLAPRAAARRGRLPARVPARGQRRAVVGMLTGCVQQVFFPQVNEATARVLAAEGCDVIIPPGQGCCGALSLHSGRAAEAARFAGDTIATFEREGVDAVVVNSAGCGSAMKEFGTMFARAEPASGEQPGDHANTPPRTHRPGGRAHPSAAHAAGFSATVRDFSEFLAELYRDHGGPRAARHELPVAAAYHDACHLAYAQRIRQQPRDLLRGIPGLDMTEVGDGGTCCGSAGVYNLLQPVAARELGERKAAALRATGARLVVSANPGCSLQIAAALGADGGEPVAVAHIAEVLDASLRGLPVTALIGR